MMAAAQPFLSGAISKTVNLPETATVEEIADVYLQGWKLGLKALAVYRDNCKVGQPLSDGKAGKADDKKSEAVETEVVEKVVYRPTRKRLPKSRPSRTTSFSVGGAEGYRPLVRTPTRLARCSLHSASRLDSCRLDGCVLYCRVQPLRRGH